MKSPAKLNINLLPKDPFLSTPLGRFMQWALTVGRYLVIFTEMVVIISFATRFSLDRRVTDLNGAIHQKETIIRSYGDLTAQIQTVQKKIESYRQVQQQYNLADTFAAITQITPQDVSLSKLEVTADTVSFNGRTLSTSSLNTLISNVQLSQKFSNVVVDGIKSGNDKEPGYQFQIHARIIQ